VEELHDIDLLTPREREVMALVADGLTNAQIAERLSISFATAKTHVSDILTRLGVGSREEAVAVWRGGPRVRSTTGRRGWLAIPLLRIGVGAAAVMSVVGGLAGVVALREETPPHELRIPLDDLAIETPLELQAEQAGVSQHSIPYPIWVVRHGDGSVDAFIGRDPHGGCHVPYEPDYEHGAGWWVLDDGSTVPNPGFIGAFKARCTGWTFSRSGDAVFGAAQRGLDGFPAAVEGDEAVVDLTQFRLGSCRLEPIQPCSRPGSEVIVPDLPPPAWIAGCPEVPRDQLFGGACPSPTPHSPTP
jgi:DNA-binding CsgD family transcriptional regulator